MQDCDTMIQVARYENQRGGVGGDIWSVAPSGANGLRLAGVDACGHGRRAYRLRSKLETQLAQAIATYHAPSDVLASVNGAAVHHDGTATGVVCDVSPLNGTGVHLRMANAGHWPPLVVTKHGEVEECSRCGPIDNQLSDLMLGVAGDTVYNDVDVELDDPLAMLFYTDGLIDLEICDNGRRLPYALQWLKDDFRVAALETEWTNAQDLVSNLRATVNHRRRVAAPLDDVSFLIVTFPFERGGR